MRYIFFRPFVLLCQVGLLQVCNSKHWVGYFTLYLFLHSLADGFAERLHRNQQCTVLLDLSSAFDTFDHLILLNRLWERFDFCGLLHQWMTSYLQDQSQRIVIGRASSKPRILTAGVPQGSVLGPLLFSLYVQPIGEVIRRHGLHFHHYADDLQVFSHLNLSQESLRDALSRLEACVAEINHRMIQNYLKMNDQKTEFLSIVPRSVRHLLLGLSLTVGDASVAAVSTVRSLGTHLTTDMEMTVNTSNIVKSCCFQLHHVTRISRYLPRKTKEWVVNELVTS